MAGCPTVVIGSSVQANAIKIAARDGTPFCEECEKKWQQEKAKVALEPDNDRLQSTFALDEFRGLAEAMSEAEFVQWIFLTFGDDIPEEACKKLRSALLGGSLPLAEIHITGKGLSGHEAAYDREKRQILVSRELVLAAREDNDEAWKLLIALLEEFGHHVDNLLRTEYSQVGGDAPLDEGSRMAYALVNLGWSEGEGRCEFAKYTSKAGEVPLEVEFKGMTEAVEKFLSAEQQEDDAQFGNLEFFNAGLGSGKPGSHGHESIEKALIEAGFSEKECHLVYFGNWLRDHSQLIDPKLLRFPGAVASLVPFTGFSRNGLTQIVDVLTRAKFEDVSHFRVNTTNLGVYRNEEHLDNPSGIEDKRSVDKMFRAACLPRELEVDPTTRMKRFIRSAAAQGSEEGYTGLKYLSDQLHLAVSKGKNNTGYLHLGQALHTLEDFFSHTNFVEVALVHVGYWVEPWVPARDGRASSLPITSGKFGGLDTAASLLLGLGESLKKENVCVAGQPTLASKIALILLKDFEFNKTYETLGGLLEDLYELEKKYPVLATLSCKTIGFVLWLFDAAIGEAIHTIGNLIDDAQTEFMSNPASTDPTHSQLAKDHDDHHLHTLAATLAKIAVKDVGLMMQQAWAGKVSSQQVVATAAKHFVHPVHIGKDDKRLLTVAAWAKSNGPKIKELGSRSRVADWTKEKAKELEELRKRADALLSDPPKGVRAVKRLRRASARKPALRSR
ncbi:heterokaryon incompatibility protein Het-C [Archangium gephyra]|uniref:Heterokaryon incompatibility protein Het-C n=1 Tax=Archangium gephyra TaxID=48 RepID=A0ABX9KAP6_9BACT|nr:heterokaryon incompatibility protein Het-C [Archangium gephyra]